MTKANAGDSKGSGDVPPAKELTLRFHGRVLEHLGIQIYQSPVNALSELVANAWDAEATKVMIDLPKVEGEPIAVFDIGAGMTFEECQNRFLNVGWNRRQGKGEDFSAVLHRRVLGRKGIGKFAGFGIANVVRIDTTSKLTGERTVFELRLNDLRKGEYINNDAAKIKVLEYLAPNESRKKMSGTRITLSELTLKRAVSPPAFRRSLALRFLMHFSSADFDITVNGEGIPEGVEYSKCEFAFPRDYEKAERPSGLGAVDKDGWGVETVGGKDFRWRFLFFPDPINEEELRGVSIFAGNKLAQAPFTFNLTGGLSGQHGLEYLAGQVEASFIDTLAEDLIATERQRINWDNEATLPLLEWGQDRIKKLLQIWRDRRGDKKRQQLEDKVSGFSQRLKNLPNSEMKTVKTALSKLAQIPALSETQYQEVGDGLLTAWEQGRLRELISQLSGESHLDEQQLLSILVETEVLTALNVAEAVKTKLLTVSGLHERVKNHELENAIRDYIAKHPELVSPEWETFQVEKSVKNVMIAAAKDAEMVGEDWKGRVDLALSSGNHLLILEFMKPGLTLDWDHVNRFERYVLALRETVEANTGGTFNRVTGYVVADHLVKKTAMSKKIQNMRKDDLFVLDWQTLLSQSIKRWEDFLEILASRSKDPRLKSLLD